MYNNIERELGLHKMITILYIVDKYEVELVDENDIKTFASETGISISDALDNLDIYLEKK